MPTIDFTDLAASQQNPKIPLAENEILTADGVGLSYSGFAVLDHVYLFVSVALRAGQTVTGAPTLDVTVEQSADGNSWATADTFSFTETGDASALLAAPANDLRVSWALGGGSEWYLATAYVTPGFPTH